MIREIIRGWCRWWWNGFTDWLGEELDREFPR